MTSQHESRYEVRWPVQLASYAAMLRANPSLSRYADSLSDPRLIQDV